MSFDDGSGLPEDRQRQQQLNADSGSNFGNAPDAESPEIIEDDDDVESFEELSEDGSNHNDNARNDEAEDEEMLSDESHPEAAEALRALQMYRGEQQEPSASDYYSDSMDEEDPDQDVSGDNENEEEEEQEEDEEEEDHHDGNDGTTNMNAPAIPNAKTQSHSPDGSAVSNQIDSSAAIRSENETYKRLEREIRELEAAHRELQRQLHYSQLQAEAARAAQNRQSITAAMDTEELRNLRTSTAREKSELDSRIVELRANADAYKADADAKERAYKALRERFNQQSTSLAKVRAQIVELQRERMQFDVQVTQATRSESRAQKQIDQLREELSLAIDEAAQARAELDLQTKTMTEIRAKAREEALAMLSEDLEGPSFSLGKDDEGVWRRQYVALRKQMDNVAAEFERREPEILALQEAHERAEERLAMASENMAAETRAKESVERRLRSSERRVTDLTVQQQLTESTLFDLRRQLLVLLTEKLLDSTHEARLSPDEEDQLMQLRDEVSRTDGDDPSEMNGQKLITERLLLFKDVAELQFQNEALLKACRELASQLDPSGDATAAALAAAHHSASEDIQAATQALEALQAKYKQLREELSISSSNEEKANKAANDSAAEVQSLKSRVQELQSQLQGARKRFTESSADMNRASTASSIRDSVAEVDEELLKLQVTSAESRLRDIQLEATQLRDEQRTLAQQFASAQLALGRAEQRCVAAETRVSELEAKSSSLSHELSILAREKQLWGEREQQLMSQIASLQTDVESAQRTAGRGQVAQEELQRRLIEQMSKIEALVASNNGLGRSEIEQTEDKKLQEAYSEASKRIEIADQKVAGLSSKISSLEQLANDLRTELQNKSQEHESLLSSWESAKASLEQEVAHLKAEKQQLENKINEQEIEAQRQAERAHARDEELVEQVNDLEDKLTESRLKTESLKESEEATKVKITEELTVELTERLTNELTDKITNDLTGELSQKLRGELRQEIEAELRSEPKSSDVTPESEMGEEARRELADNLEKELRAEISSRLQSELRESLRPDVENALKSELVPKLSADVRSQLEKEIRTEMESKSQVSSSSAEVVPSVEEPNAHATNEGSGDDIVPSPSNGAPEDLGSDDVSGLRQRLVSQASAELVDRFEQAVLAAEQLRVRDAFKVKLSAVRVEAQQHGEDVATKRSEIRTKLQNQKLSKLEQSNRNLETQVEELRNKVRRLKGGGAIDEESNVDPQDESDKQSQEQQQQSVPPEQPIPFSWPAPQNPFFAPSVSAFGSAFDTQKRPGSFEDNEAKKRKEE